MDAVLKHLIKISKGKTVLDIGANDLSYTFAIADVAEKVIAFDPMPISHATEQAVNVLYRNVQFINKGVVSTDPEKMHVRSGRFGHQDYYLTDLNSLEKNEDQIERTAETAYIYDVFVQYKPDVVKIDIQGYDLSLVSSILRMHYVDSMYDMNGGARAYTKSGRLTVVFEFSIMCMERCGFKDWQETAIRLLKYCKVDKISRDGTLSPVAYGELVSTRDTHLDLVFEL